MGTHSAFKTPGVGKPFSAGVMAPQVGRPELMSPTRPGTIDNPGGQTPPTLDFNQMGVTNPGMSQQSQPDYGSMIGGDWEVQGAQAAMAAQMALARSQFQANLRQAFIDLGYSGDQSNLGEFSSYLDKNTIQKAIDNKYSAYNQIKQGEVKAQGTNDSQLAAMGMAGSGEDTRSTQDVVNQAESGRYSSLRDFLQGGTTGLQGIAQLKAQLAAQLAQARAAAAARAAQMAAWGGGGGGGYNGYLANGDVNYGFQMPGDPNMTNDQYTSIGDAWTSQLPIHSNGAWGQAPVVRPPHMSFW